MGINYDKVLFDHDQHQDLCNSLTRIARAITPNAAGGTDASGGHVESATEAMMGITAGLHAIAKSIDRLAEAVEKHG